MVFRKSDMKFMGFIDLDWNQWPCDDPDGITFRDKKNGQLKYTFGDSWVYLVCPD